MQPLPSIFGRREVCAAGEQELYSKLFPRKSWARWLRFSEWWGRCFVWLETPPKKIGAETVQQQLQSRFFHDISRFVPWENPRASRILSVRRCRKNSILSTWPRSWRARLDEWKVSSGFIAILSGLGLSILGLSIWLCSGFISILG